MAENTDLEPIFQRRNSVAYAFLRRAIRLAHYAGHRHMTADSASTANSEKTHTSDKDVASIEKQLKELEDYERRSSKTPPAGSKSNSTKASVKHKILVLDVKND
jgi:hypothetical protein